MDFQFIASAMPFTLFTRIIIIIIKFFIMLKPLFDPKYIELITKMNELLSKLDETTKELESVYSELQKMGDKVLSK